MHLERIRSNKIWIWCEHVGLVMNLAYQTPAIYLCCICLIDTNNSFDIERHFDINQEHLLHVLFG